MDSLLANYGSDEEDADSPPGSPKPAVVKTSASLAPSWNRQSLFGSLPPPKNSAAELSLWDDEDEPVRPGRRVFDRDAGEDLERIVPTTSSFTSLPPPRNSTPESSLWNNGDEALRSRKRNIDREVDSGQITPPSTSLFTSLPPPKLENADWGEPLEVRPLGPKLEPGYDDRTEKKRIGSLPSSLRPPKLESETLPSGFFDDPSPAVDRSSSQKQDIPEAKPSSLFAQRLPPPASSKPSFEKLPRPSTSKPKQVVEFKPPINYALLEKTEEDDLERSRKRSKLSTEGDAAMEPNNGGGLMSFLPPPKNSLGAGAALGGAGLHGSRRTMMETASDSYNTGNEVTSNSGNIKIEKVEVNVERPTLGAPNYAYEVEPAVQSGEGFYAQPGIYHDQNPQQPYVEIRYGNHDGYSIGNGYDERSLQYPEANAFPGARSQPSQGQDVLAEVMKKERRKGRDEPPPQMIEVKQADLTGGSKVREDQIRSTGIAFGPSYQPAASNKDKPSKLHRRKHQIGALYFDMKQNEMNLLDRRAKGNLTKAETQAKYGW